jgi:SAM-dependent methyltransferase
MSPQARRRTLLLSAAAGAGLALATPPVRFARAQDFATPPRLDVPFVPTPQEVVDRMLGLAKVGKTDTLYDLGCGDGRIVVTAARQFGARGVGIDLNPERIAEAQANARKAGVEQRVKFRVAARGHGRRQRPHHLFVDHHRGAERFGRKEIGIKLIVFTFLGYIAGFTFPRDSLLSRLQHANARSLPVQAPECRLAGHRHLRAGPALCRP